MGKYIDSVWVDEQALKSIEYMQRCYELLQKGEQDKIVRNPLAARNPPLTDEEVDKVIEGIDTEFTREMTNSTSWHFNHSGAETTPDFHRLEPDARRALVEGLDYIQRTVEVDVSPQEQQRREQLAQATHTPDYFDGC